MNWMPKRLKAEVEAAILAADPQELADVQAEVRGRLLPREAWTRVRTLARGVEALGRA